MSLPPRAITGSVCSARRSTTPDTGLICIGWLGDAPRMRVALPTLDGAWRTHGGQIRLAYPPLRTARIVPAAYDLIRPAGANSSAVIVRLLQTCARFTPLLRDDEQRQVMLDQAEAARASMSRISKSIWIGRRLTPRINWLVSG